MKYVSAVILFISILFSCKSHKNKINYDDIRFKTDTIEGIYIPYGINDCLSQLDSFFDDSTKTEIKNMSESDFSGLSHFGLGIWMRNNWGLWGGSRLSKCFNDLGIYHPDDMSGIIVTSYYRHIKELPIDINKQIVSSQNYWKVNATPKKEDFPKGLKKIETKSGYNYEYNGEDYGGCLQIIRDKETDNYWLYDYHYGWKKTDQPELLKINENAPLSHDFVKSIFEK